MIISRMKYVLLMFPLLFHLFVSCAPATRFSRPVDRQNPEVSDNTSSGLQNIIRQWLNVPYHYGGIDRYGIDCSGLTCKIYEEAYGINLPRTAREQMQGGVFVRQPWLKEGDLLFFREGRGGFRDHVGLYLSDGNFIHASVSSGVTISNLFDTYYQERLISVRRYLP